MLEIAVFLCGAVVMVLEIVGSRVLAPFVGTSVVVWTSLIGVVLGAMSLGYHQGGRLADRRPEPRVLARIILAAAPAAALPALAKVFLLDWLTAAPELPVLLIAPLLAAALFAPAAFLLGMVAPFAVRLRLTDPATSGRTAGNLYALSTVGSIAGTFLAGFVLVAHLGSTFILFLLGGVLAVASLLVRAEPRPAALTAAALALCAAAVAALDAGRADAGFHDLDTPFQRVWIYPSAEEGAGRPLRIMATSPGGSQSALYPDEPEALALAYTRFLPLAAALVPEARRMLMLGGGGYSVPRHLLPKHPGLTMDVVEIDPGVTNLARRFFHLRDTPGLSIHHQDARIFLARAAIRSPAAYDAVLLDVFNARYAAPFHLASLEAARLMAACLAPHGALLANILAARDGDSGRFLRAELAAFAQVFPHLRLFAVNPSLPPDQRQNHILLAARDNPDPALANLPPDLAPLAAHLVPLPLAGDVPALTDDFAPVERYLGWR